MSATMKLSDAMQCSTSVMTKMNELMKVGEVQKDMAEMAREMQKVVPPRWGNPPVDSVMSFFKILLPGWTDPGDYKRNVILIHERDYNNPFGVILIHERFSHSPRSSSWLYTIP